MSGLAEILLAEIDAGADEWVRLLQDFVRKPTPNPPGDTRAGDRASRELPRRTRPRAPADRPACRKRRTWWRSSTPRARDGTWCSTAISTSSPPATPAAGSMDPWSGAIEDGRLYGRGVADMKCGTTASLITYALLHKHRDRLAGQLSLTCVSDEETGGRWGAGYLFAHHPRIRPRRLLPERRAVFGAHRALGREAAAVARLHGEDARRARRLRPYERKRQPHRP